MNLPEEFYKEEVRNDYRISSEMKKIWSVELDLFNQLDKICKRHNITYYADGGTLLGAVRHHGFIPWDDDMDFMMYRDDFEKLCSVASEFKEPYFFQTEETDPGSLRCHAQLRNSNTTGILKFEEDKKYPFNQGIFIDIFPLDNVPEDRDERLKFVNNLKELKQKAREYYDFNHGFAEKPRITGFHTLWQRINFPNKKRGYERLFKVYGEKNPYYKEYKEKVTKYKDSTGYVMDIAIHDDSKRLNSQYFGKPKYVPFEMVKMPIPENYDNILNRYYGDWHKLVRGQNIHGGCIFDVKIPYNQYLSK
ncbi:LicD family protein [Lactobacillus paragasseri]|uniref:LicD family protein n=1 Tax=Lactobacillus paragasseri TaxID=2107999 RepID=UPI0021CB3DDE|nr:LicD family protein [Lactobacillus paragasseri]MDK7951759.1 LicD family protein [Lactobacillus paragasseri]MDX5059570.1 LicD family protein [Lactobacillus paragasseri]